MTSNEEKMDMLLEKISNLEIQVEMLSDILTTHISFIDQVYDTLKSPINFITNAINRISSNGVITPIRISDGAITPNRISSDEINNITYIP